MINRNNYQQIQGREIGQQEVDRKWRIFEQEQASFYQNVVVSRACIDTPTFQTITNTNWIYPPRDVEYSLTDTTTPFTRVGNVLYFGSISDMGAVYDDIFERTEATQPIGNVGYSLGVGTLLQDLFETLEFRLNDEELIVTWQLTKQLTDQNDLPAGGDSPVGVIGYLTVYENWPIGNRPQYYDPVLNQLGPIICV
jgi:hypothetical protein